MFDDCFFRSSVLILVTKGKVNIEPSVKWYVVHNKYKISRTILKRT